MKTNEINKILVEEEGYIRLMIGKIPTWLHGQQGFEFQTELTPFSAETGERNYEKVSEEQRRIMRKIKDYETTSSQKETPKQPENIETTKEEMVININNIDGILPDFFTSALISKWAKMTTTDRILLFQKTPSDKIKHVSVTKTKTAPYIEGNFMFKEANAAFLFDWNLSDIKISICPTGVGVSGTLNAWFSEYGKYISRPATGYQELNNGNDIELAKKGAITDAIKKGLSLFGFNSDVYGGDIS